MEFVSPSRGALTFEQVFEELIAFMDAAPEERYRLIIGTDSRQRNETVFVSAIIIHREGKGARYFYRRLPYRKMESLRQRIFFEASLSLSLAGKLTERLAWNGHADTDVEIHLDVGSHGETRELIRE